MERKFMRWSLTAIASVIAASSLYLLAGQTFAADTVASINSAALPDTTDSGDNITFNFQNIDVRSLLQLIAKTSGQNFIISDAVTGRMTLNLRNVTWREALNIILKSRGLAERRVGDAIYISTAEEVRAADTRQYQNVQDIINYAPLVSRILHIKYADPLEIANLLKGTQGTLLSSRGSVAVDTRTNNIVIKDVYPVVAEITREINRIDIPVRQVAIEARIVNLDVLYEEQLGVRFGVSNTRSVSGTLDGANQLAMGTDVADINPLIRRLNFNGAANALTSGALPASFGLALAHLGPVLLDLELSALEEEGHSQIVSRPRVVTSNNRKATIETGEEIPYQEATSSGATSISFKKAVLSLTIIPQITPDNKIILRLKATQDTRGPQLIISGSSTDGSTTTGATFGPPTINTQAVESNVLLRDNETIVVGGIYKQSKTNTMDRVPFFGTIPFVGNLFRHQGLKNETTELLIFLTPHIIHPATYGLQDSPGVAPSKGEA